jgi:ATP-binding cassette subfamily B multidrug efflux pump
MKRPVVHPLLRPFFIQAKTIIALGLVCLIIVDFLQLCIPIVVKRTIDGLTLFAITPPGLLQHAGIILLLGGLIFIFRYAWRRCLLGTSRRIEEGLRNQLFCHLQTLSASFFATRTTGDLMAHATNDIKQIRMACGMGLVALTDALVLGSAALGFMAWFSVRLSLLVLIPMPAIVLGTRIFGKMMHKRYRTVQSAYADLTEYVREWATGIRVIKADNLQEISLHRLDAVSTTYIRKNLQLVKITGSFIPLMLFLSNLSLAIILFFGGRQTIHLDLSTGELVAFISYLGLLTWPMMALGWVTNLIQRGRASLDRIAAIMETRPQVSSPADAIREAPQFHTLECRQVVFTYPRRRDPVLANLSFRIRRGRADRYRGASGER